MLFTGTRGVGKRAAAFRFAMACNCRTDESDPCGDCRACRKIASGNHPDVIHIKPTGTLIRIAQIRELYHTLAMRPYEASVRVVIISDAQMMNPEAGNALLKMLEEPPDRTVLILTADQASDLLPTIVSRCQRIRFRPISSPRLEEMLVEEEALDGKDAKIIAAMANGSYTAAVKLSRSAWVVKRDWLIDEIVFLTAKPAKPVDRMLILAEKLSGDKEMLSYAFDVMMSWLRDLVIFKYCPNKIINTDLADRIKRHTGDFSTDALMSKIMAIRKAQREIFTNANIRLITETLIFKLSQT
jgi:DNA polymerase III subunit delta'